MPKSHRPSVKLYTLIDLGSVTNLSTLPPADEEDPFDWEEDDADHDELGGETTKPVPARQAPGASRG
jgi:hypothetical protein